MTRRGDRVPRPAGPDEWDLYAADDGAGQGWDELCRSHPAAMRAAFDTLQGDPRQRTHRTVGAWSGLWPLPRTKGRAG
jgi:hypothetical protein